MEDNRYDDEQERTIHTFLMDLGEAEATSESDECEEPDEEDAYPRANAAQ